MSGRFERTSLTPGLPLGAPSPGASFSDLIETMGLAPRIDMTGASPGAISVPEGTTVLALRYGDGVVMAGDRQATEGHLVAHRHIQKVFEADRHSAVAIAGTAGLAIEMVRLFQTELEHYEKIEGTVLSLEGKATFLARLVRQQLPMAFQGLAVVPIFAGYDRLTASGRLFTYDVVGGRYEEQDFGATGSGARLAKSYLRTAYTDDVTQDGAIDLAIRALVAAAEEDTATGGPDIRRGILPTVLSIDSTGGTWVPAADVSALASAALEASR
ncbi:MAG: proteasome subunit beta [Acidimicrobiia bacterium]